MNLEIRKLRTEDINKGFLESLYNLNDEPIDLQYAYMRFNYLSKHCPEYHIYVAVQNDEVIGTACLQLDYKFIHNCSRAGRIEDVSTRKGYEGQGVASAIIEKLIEVAKENSCYKITLACRDHLKPFYEKFGFEAKSHDMKIYLS